ncbi:MAG TPA: tetratricopeptide repeat protein, partial [Thermoanaerobaculia bacterium]|nr:tetratricopeptide repeat protein [Thermoanaerobaculia bacterium]
KEREAATVGGRSAQEKWDELLREAQTAYDAKDYLLAKQKLDEASALRQIPPDMRALYDGATNKVAQLDAATNLFKEGNYSDAIINLQTILDQDPDNASARKMLLDAHFNLGAVALRDTRLDEAAAHFNRVIEQNPNDELAVRSRDLALRYQDERPDLLFRIYTTYLPLR